MQQISVIPNRMFAQGHPLGFFPTSAKLLPASQDLCNSKPQLFSSNVKIHLKHMDVEV